MLQRPYCWTVHAFERLQERYPEHRFTQESLDAVVPRIEDAFQDQFDARAYAGGKVQVDVTIEAVPVRVVYNYVGKRVFTTLAPYMENQNTLLTLTE